MKGINLVLEEHGGGDLTQACDSVRFPEKVMLDMKSGWVRITCKR